MQRSRESVWPHWIRLYLPPLPFDKNVPPKEIFYKDANNNQFVLNRL